MRQLVSYQEELSVNYCRLVCVSVDEPKVCGAFRYGLGASFPFLSDEKRGAIDLLGIRDQTEGEYPGCAIPMTYVLSPDLTIYKVYNGWFFVGRPTLEELRMDLRELMSRRSNYAYEEYNRPEVKAIRVPAEKWLEPQTDGGPKFKGVVQWFSLDDGYGVIEQSDGKLVFMHFTGIPGEGYRTVDPGAVVEYERVESPTGVPCAVNIEVLKSGEEQGPGSLKSGVISGLNL